MAQAQAQQRSGGAMGAERRAAAFTLVELLVVIAVIGVIVAVLLAVGTHVLDRQKATNTRSIMTTVRLALDQFATEDPLRGNYDNPKMRDSSGNLIIGRTFGPYPPYQLKDEGGNDSVAKVLEPRHALSSSTTAPTLYQRLAWDLSGERSPAVGNWVGNSLQGQLPDQVQHNDIRALYTYLAVYSPGVVTQIPAARVKALVPGTPEYVNPTGVGTVAGNAGLIDVFGIHDAWGVPMDYFLHVKLEYKVGPDGTPRWIVTDRVPVLRSRGASKEEVAAADEAATGGDETLLQPQRWIYSESFPVPAAVVDANGNLSASPVQGERVGWARAVGVEENYKYVPESQP